MRLQYMVSAMTITVEQLQKKEACETQAAVFAEEWPNGAKLSLANCFCAVELGLNLEWFAREFLSPSALEEYDKATALAWEECRKAIAPALEECNKATALAWEEYDKARAPALEEHDKAIAPAWEEYNKAIALALEEYKKARALAREEHDKARALALYHALIKQTGALEAEI